MSGRQFANEEKTRKPCSRILGRANSSSVGKNGNEDEDETLSITMCTETAYKAAKMDLTCEMHINGEWKD